MRNFLILLLLFFSTGLFAQEIPNSSFENWVSVGGGGYEDPANWNTANSTTYTAPFYLTTTNKTSDSNSGNYAAKLESKTILTFAVPGLITLGEFSVDIWTQNSSITGGIPFNIRPDKMKLYYKYEPTSGDNFRIGMWLLKNNGTDTPDTIGTALYENGIPKTQFTALSLDIDYRSNETPDILNIIAVSTNPDNPRAGSTLIVDDFVFECSTGIISIEMLNDIVWPNPATEVIYVNEKYANSGISVYDNKGILLFRDFSKTIDISMLPKGIYYVKIADSQKIQKIIKL